MRNLNSMVYVDCDCELSELQRWVEEAITPFKNLGEGYNYAQAILFDTFFNKEHLKEREKYRFTIHVFQGDDAIDENFMAQVSVIKAVLKTLREHQCQIDFLIPYNYEYFDQEE